MSDEDNQVNENEFEDFADFVSVAVPGAHDLESLTVDTEVRPEEPCLRPSVAETTGKDQEESLVVVNQSIQFPSPPELDSGSTGETRTSVGLNEGFDDSGLRDNGDTAVSAIALDDMGRTSNLAATDSSDSDEDGFGSFEDALQDEADASEDTGAASEVVKKIYSPNNELTKNASQCLDKEPISNAIISDGCTSPIRSETQSTQNTVGLSPIKDEGNGAVESTSAESEHTPDLVVTFSEKDETEDFGDFSCIDSAGNATKAKIGQHSSSFALVSHSEESNDLENVRNPDREDVEGDDNGSIDDDFGDFDQAPPSDYVPEQQTGDKDDDFGDFDAAVEENPAANTSNMHSYPDIPVVQKANQVFQQIFTRHETLSCPSDDEPTHDHPSCTMQSILETLQTSQAPRRAYDCGALTAYLQLRFKSDNPRPTPARHIINEGGGPYSHYSLPLGGIQIRQTEASTQTGFTLPEVMNVRLPPSPERQSSIAQPSENSMKSDAPFTTKPKQPENADHTRIVNVLHDDVIEDFIRRIPDLSFILSHTFVPPNGKAP